MTSSLVALTHEAAAEWTRLGSENQRGFCDQLRNSMELARSACAPDTEARAAELYHSAQGALRLNVMALLRTKARLAQAWSDFWMPPSEGPENRTSTDV